MGVLETGTHQNLRVLLTQIDRAIPVVHVKIQYRHTINAWQVQRVDRRDRDAVQQAKPHGRIELGVVTRWSHRTEHPGLTA